MSLSALAAILAFAAYASGEKPAAWDPPLNLPALKLHHAKEAPTEAQFAHACFEFIYATLGGKQGPPKLPVDQIEQKVMAACRQNDREGCKTFGQQLQKIVEKKEKESSKVHEKHAHLKGGKPHTRKSKEEKPKVQVVEAPKLVPQTEKKDEDNYGMKVWKPKKKSEKTSTA